MTLFRKMPYDPVKDLAPITLVVTTPQFFVVHPDVPAKNVVTFKPGKEMEEKVRAKGRLPSPEAQGESVVLGNDEEDGQGEAVGSAKSLPRPQKM